VSFRRCFVLVDWWSQIRPLYLKNRVVNNGRNSEMALRNIERIVEHKLQAEAPQPKRWEILFRLYAGWMSGGSPTYVLRDYDAMLLGYANRRRKGESLKSAIFLPGSIGVRRGDRLLADTSGRRVDKRLSVHFPFTSRSECNCQLCKHLNRKSQDGFTCDRIMEKQVDSALVADAITLSLYPERAKLIIISNDDDVVPGLIVGEAFGGDICLINTIRKNHLHAKQLSDIIYSSEDVVK